MKRLLVLTCVFSLTTLLGCGGSGGGSSSSGSTAPVTSNPGGTNPGGTNPGGTPSHVTPMALPSGPVGGAQVQGIDVAQYQGTIDWSKVAGSGIGFAFARVSDGTHFPDPEFAANWSGMKANGVVRGVYQYFRAGTDPTAQANLLLGAVGTLQPGDLPPVCDVETLDGQSASTLVANLKTWVSAIKTATGLTPIIYCGSGFWNTLGTTMGNDDLWVANWQVSSPSIPSGWVTWWFWQYNDTGTIPGVPSAPDVDVFNGSADDLAFYSGVKKTGFIRGLAVDSTNGGYWLASIDGGVFEFGDATWRGTAGGQTYPQPFLGIVRTPTGFGYWLYTADGNVVGFGDATVAGTATPSAPICSMAATPTGKGYWLLGQDGAVYPIGDASTTLGAPTSAQLTNQPISIVATPTGNGYWIALADGSVLPFGDAGSLGTPTATTSPFVAMAGTPTGKGYWLVQEDGTVSSFGDAPALAATPPTSAAPIVSITSSLTGQGFFLVASDGTVFPYGDAVDGGSRVR